MLLVSGNSDVMILCLGVGDLSRDGDGDRGKGKIFSTRGQGMPPMQFTSRRLL